MATTRTALETTFLPFHVPLIEREEIQAAHEVLETGWLTTGPKAKAFEKEFAAQVGALHGVALNSGTAALHLALSALGVGAGDEVILPSLTFAATAEVVTYLNAVPVLVDSTAPYWNIDLEAIEKAITKRTKAIIPVHFGGHPCEMDEILELARKHNIRVVEDAAHAFPAYYKGRSVGSMGDVTCFSCYATKTITTGGEGGVAVTDDPDVADSIRIKSLHGISKDAWKRYTPTGSWRYEILEAGHKYNLTDLAAAIGLAQLQKANRMWLRRLEIRDRYSRNLRNETAFELPSQSPQVDHAWHLYVILLNHRAVLLDRDRLIDELRLQGIGTSVHFIPLHLHPYYRNTWGYAAGAFPVCEDYSERCLSLPIYPGMTDEDVDRVSDALLDIAEKFRR